MTLVAGVDRTAELEAVAAAACRVMPAAAVADWLETPAAIFDGLRPADEIAAYGAARVLEVLEAIAGGYLAL